MYTSTINLAKLSSRFIAPSSTPFGTKNGISRFQEMLEQANGTQNGAMPHDPLAKGEIAILDRQIVNQLATLVRSAIQRAEQMWQGSAFSYPQGNQADWSSPISPQGQMVAIATQRSAQAAQAGGIPAAQAPTDASLQNPGSDSTKTQQGTASAAPSTQAAQATLNQPGLPYQDLINKAAAEYDLDPNLIASVIKVESNFDTTAVSRVGAQGLMQLMPQTGESLGVTDAFDPEQNIMAGSKYLKQLLNRYQGEKDLALAAYNWGMGNLERRPEEMPLETRNYIAKVSNLLEQAAPGTSATATV